MFTGVALLGVLAGSLASLFGVPSETNEDAASTPPTQVADGGTWASVEDELAILRSQLAVLEHGLGELAAHIRSLGSSAS
jgi:hypothetical protein